MIMANSQIHNCLPNSTSKNTMVIKTVKSSIPSTILQSNSPSVLKELSESSFISSSFLSRNEMPLGDSLENHQNSFNSAVHHYHQQYQNGELPEAMKLSSLSSCTLSDDSNTGKVKIFHDEEECGVTSQEASGNEVPEESSTKSVHRNSTSSRSSYCSSSSALLTTSYESKQSISPVSSIQYNKINIHKKTNILNHPSEVSLINNATVFLSCDYQTKSNHFLQNNHIHQHKTRNDRAKSALCKTKETSTHCQIKGFRSNNHCSCLGKQQIKKEQLDHKVLSQNLVHNKLYNCQNHSKISEPKKEYRQHIKQFDCNCKEQSGRRISSGNIECCLIHNLKSSAKPNSFPIYMKSESRVSQDTTTDLCYSKNSTLSRPSTSNSLRRMFHNKNCSNHQQSIKSVLPLSTKDKRTIPEDGKQKAIDEVQLLTFGEESISARHTALGRKQAKIQETRTNLQFKNKETEIRRKPIEASKQQNLYQLTKQSHQQNVSGCQQWHQNQQKTLDRPSFSGSKYSINNCKINNNPKSSTSRNANELVITSQQATTITCPIGFGSSTPRFACYTSKELMHLKHPPVSNTNNSSKFYSALSNRTVSNSSEYFGSQPSKTKSSIIHSGPNNIKQQFNPKNSLHYCINKRMVESTHQHTINCFNSTGDKFNYPNWKSFSVYSDRDPVDSGTSIESSEQSTILKKQSIRKRNSVVSTTSSSINSRNARSSIQSKTLSSPFMTKSSRNPTNSAKSTKPNERSRIQLLASTISSSSKSDTSRQSFLCKLNSIPFKSFDECNKKNNNSESREVQNVKPHKSLDAFEQNLETKLSNVPFQKMSFSDLSQTDLNFDINKPESINETIMVNTSMTGTVPLTTTATDENSQKSTTDRLNPSSTLSDYYETANLIVEEIIKSVTSDWTYKITQSLSMITDKPIIETVRNPAGITKHLSGFVSIPSTLAPVSSPTSSVSPSISTLSSSSMIKNYKSMTEAVVATCSDTPSSVMKLSTVNATSTVTARSTLLPSSLLTAPCKTTAKRLDCDHIFVNVVNSNEQVVNVSTESVIDKTIDVVTKQQLYNDDAELKMSTNETKWVGKNENEIQITNVYHSNMINTREKPIQVVHPLNAINSTQSGKLVISLSTELAEREERKKRLEEIMSRIKLHSKDPDPTINEYPIENSTNIEHNQEHIHHLNKFNQETTSILRDTTVITSVQNTFIHSSTPTTSNTSQESQNILVTYNSFNDTNTDKNYVLSKCLRKPMLDNEDYYSDKHDNGYDTTRNRASIVANMLASGRLDRRSRAAGVLFTMILKNQTDLDENNDLDIAKKLDNSILDINTSKVEDRS
ncbi:hypothetical protein EWB00_003563 [Schistosoma japonicum]|uniref:Uncharacterized protein n=1 Tax=Schistosoma japonicum TaxID=6182 RepID=A0A4Z2D891_SCHJA|nr:hypothetical protein EWB00_003563 [Schistosoma japonicum]